MLVLAFTASKSCTPQSNVIKQGIDQNIARGECCSLPGTQLGTAALSHCSLRHRKLRQHLPYHGTNSAWCKMGGGLPDTTNLAPLAAQAFVAVPAAERMVRHEGRRGDHHEAVAYPKRVREAPQQLTQCLHSTCL